VKEKYFGSQFYENIMKLLGLKSLPTDDLMYIINRNFKNIHMCTYDNKQLIRIDNEHYIPRIDNLKPIIIFHPLNELEESCSHLLIYDSIHLYLRNLTFSIFSQMMTTEDGTIVQGLFPASQKTKYKFQNLFNIVTATSFSKNVIGFDIDFINSPKNAKVNFKYPLYNMLHTIQNNTIFGIHLEDNEIKLFKQIYETHIIAIIDNLFKDSIEIPALSSQYPRFYILVTIKLMLEEIYWKEYSKIGLSFLNGTAIERYKDMLPSLNDHPKYKYFESIYTESNQKLDQEAYKNEIQIRQESEPNWLLLKGNEVGNEKQQLVVIENNNIGQIIDRFGSLIEYNLKQYQNKIRKFNADILAQRYKDDYQIWENDQEWNDIFTWQNLVLDILQSNGGGLYYDIRINKYCFRSKFNGSPTNVDSNTLGELLSRALREKIIAYINQNDRTSLSDYAIEIVLVSKLNGINKQKLNIQEKANNVIKILLFENAIPAIDDDVFDINNNYIYFKQHVSNLFFTRNRFVSNQYLAKRYQQKQDIIINNEEQTFIEKFIYHLVKENHALFYYIMNWLAYYFQHLQKSKTALVLLGEQEVTQGIFWNIIIKEIFSQQYCATINDKEQDTVLVSSHP